MRDVFLFKEGEKEEALDSYYLPDSIMGSMYPLGRVNFAPALREQPFFSVQKQKRRISLSNLSILLQLIL